MAFLFEENDNNFKLSTLGCDTPISKKAQPCDLMLQRVPSIGRETGLDQQHIINTPQNITSLTHHRPQANNENGNFCS